MNYFGKVRRTQLAFVRRFLPVSGTVQPYVKFSEFAVQSVRPPASGLSSVAGQIFESQNPQDFLSDIYLLFKRSLVPTFVPP